MKTYLSDEQIEHLQSLFYSETEYVQIVSNLQKTGFGLSAIAQKQPSLRGNIQPQINAIKKILGALRQNETFEVSEFIRVNSQITNKY